MSSGANDASGQTNCTNTPVVLGGDKLGQREVLDLYKLYVGNAEAVVQRRHGVNTFFLSANSALLAAVALLVEFGDDETLGAIAIGILSVAGMTLCFTWKRLITLYGRQRASMFAVIYEVEDLIGLRLYKREWQEYSSGADPKTHKTFTTAESSVPIVIALIYVVVCAGSVAWATVAQ